MAKTILKTNEPSNNNMPANETLLKELSPEEKEKLTKEAEEEKVFIKGLGFCSFGLGSNAAVVHVKGGRIIRIRPLHYDWKYKPEEFNPWKIEARGK